MLKVIKWSNYLKEREKGNFFEAWREKSPKWSKTLPKGVELIKDLEKHYGR